MKEEVLTMEPSHEAKEQIKENLRLLNEKLNNSPQVLIEKFRNWGRNQSALVLAVRPRTLSEIQKIVRAAGELQLKIRCTGKSHSWSPLFADDCQICMYMADLEYEDKDKPKIRLNQRRGDEPLTITMLANATSGEVMEFEIKNQVCLLSTVTLETVHSAGVVAVGCHGAARDQPCTSDYVQEISMVDSSGELRTYNKENMEVLKAAQCSLGLFGIIYEITMEVSPMKIVDTVSRFLKADEILLDAERLKKFAEEHWCTEIFWFPFNSMSFTETLLVKALGFLPGFMWNPAKDKCWVRTMDLVDIPSNPLLKEEDYQMKRNAAFAENVYLRIMTDFLVERPANVPGVLKAGVEYILEQVVYKEASELLPRAIHYDSWVDLCPTTGIEWVFNVTDSLEDYKIITKAVKILQQKTKLFAKKKKFPVNITMQVRWTGKSQCLLSPASCHLGNCEETERTFYLCVVSVTGSKGWTDFCNEVSNELVRLPKKPHLHWAKQWGDIKAINTQYLQKVYGSNFTRFRSALAEVNADPDGMFRNKTLTDLIFPSQTQHDNSDDVDGQMIQEETAQPVLAEQLQHEAEEMKDETDSQMEKKYLRLSKKLASKGMDANWERKCQSFAQEYMSLRKTQIPATGNQQAADFSDLLTEVANGKKSKTKNGIEDAIQCVNKEMFSKDERCKVS